MSEKDRAAEALRRAIRLAGGTTALAARLREIDAPCTQQAISQWRQVPPLRVLAVERITGVSRTELRPDLYPSEAAE